jgi:hypothetical protein
MTCVNALRGDESSCPPPALSWHPIDFNAPMDDSGSNVTGESGLELSDFLLHQYKWFPKVISQYLTPKTA